MNGTVLPAWLHSIVFAVLSVYMFMLWAGLKRDSLSEAQKRLVGHIEVLRPDARGAGEMAQHAVASAMCWERPVTDPAYSLNSLLRTSTASSTTVQRFAFAAGISLPSSGPSAV